MCNPTAVLIGVSVASAGLQYQQAKAQQKAQFEQQKRQNELAKRNALQRYASEQLKIRQIADEKKQKSYEATLKSRKARSEYITSAGASGLALTGSTNRLLADYYRVEGNYKNSLERNLNINIGQFERNLQAIQFNQEAQSTYVQPPNPELLFVSSALNVANTYYSLEAQKEASGLMTNRQKANYDYRNNYIRSDLGSS